MFRKIVSNLAFSPALVGQLSFYAKRLRKEEATRRIGLIFVALALVVQSFAVFSPPESANAADADNIIYSGIRDKTELLSIYDHGSDSAGRNDIKQIYAQFGVTRADLANTQLGTYHTNDFNHQLNSIGRSDWGVSYRTPLKVAGTNTTVYTGGWIDTNGRNVAQQALIGHRAIDGAWFAITLACGNLVYAVPPPPAPQPAAVCSALNITPISRTEIKLDATANATNGATISGYTYTVKDAKAATVVSKTVTSAATSSSIQQTITKDGTYSATVSVTTSLGSKTATNCAKNFIVSPEPVCKLNSALVQSSPDCKPCLNDTTLWYKDKACVATFELSKTVRNVTQSIADAAGTTAQSGDQLQYTLTVKNTGKGQGPYTMTDNVADIMQYADIVDLGDGQIVTTNDQNAATPAVATWPVFSDVKPGQVIQRTILVKVKTTIPAMATNTTNPQSYNCKITNTFGNTINVGIACPPEKVAEQVITQLPHTGASENIIFSGVVLAVVVYFYARSRQTSKEIRLIRRDLNAGTI
ncbi:MAG: hypothetical protein ACHQTE_00200 [Candidatus Saccharimonadales bacterium]